MMNRQTRPTRFKMDEQFVSDEIKRLIPVVGKEGAEKLTKAYLLGDEKIRQHIFELVDVIKAAVFSDKDLRDSILMEPPNKAQAMNGDIEIGHVLYGRKKLYPFMLDSKMLLMHIGIFGSSGYGKTNLSYCLIKNLADRNIPVLIFDFSKRNYKDLLNTDLGNKIDIYTIGKNAAPFRFNPLKPPQGVQLSQWMKEFAAVFDHAYWLLGGGRHVILKAISKVFEKNDNPTLKDLKEWIFRYGESEMASRERNWLATAERPLESLCFKEIGEIFECEEGIPPSEFFKPGRITILELDPLSTNDKTFLIEILLQWIRDWMLVSSEREKLRGVIILEEAHHILNREKSSKLGSETVIDLIFREVRELGLGMIYIDQHPSLISYPALGNTSVHVYMNLGLDTKHSSDILDATNMLGLKYEEDGNYLRRLPIGHGFMLCRQSEFPFPFLIEFPKFDIKKGSVSDDDIREHMINRIKTEYLKKPKETTETIETILAVSKNSEKTQKEELDEICVKIVEAIGNAEGVATAEIYRFLNISGSVFAENIEKITVKGLVDVARAKKGRQAANYYFLTKLGQEFFEKNFGSRKEEHKIDKEQLKSMLMLGGWEYKERDNILYLKKETRELRIVLETDYRLDKMRTDLQEGTHFICANESIRRALLQQAARLAREQAKRITVFSVVADKFLESGSFERIDIE